MADMVEMVVDSVRLSLMTSEGVIVLREKTGERFLPIFVTRSMADGITASLNDIVTIQPSSWNLIINSLKGLNAKIVRTEIVRLADDIYYGNIVAGSDGNLKNIDARSSDAIAVAVCAHIPILVSSDVMDVAGIVRELDIRTLPLQGVEPPPSPKQEADEKYLSLYKDFLKNLDWGDSEKNDKDDDKDNP